MPKKFLTIGFANGFNCVTDIFDDSASETKAFHLGGLSLKEASRIYWNLYDVEFSLNFSGTTMARIGDDETGDIISTTYHNLQIGNNLEYSRSEYNTDAKHFFREIHLPIKTLPPHSLNDPRLMDDNLFSMDSRVEMGSPPQAYFYLYGPFIEDNGNVENTSPFELSYYYLIDFNLSITIPAFLISTDLQNIKWNNVSTKYVKFLGHDIKFYVATNFAKENFTYSCDLSLKEKMWQPSDYQDD